MSEKTTVIRVTVIGMMLNFFLAVIKYVLGVLGGSSALIADAIHSLSDIISDVVVIIGVRYWTRPADSDHPHGHKKIELMSSLFIGVLLFLVGIGIVYDAVIAIYEKNASTPGLITLVAALLSIVMKEILFRWTIVKGKSIKSSALIANAWHHRSDALSSIPVAISIIIAYLFPLWSFVDLIGAIIVATFIFGACYKIIRDSFNSLLDASAPKEILDLIKNITYSVGEVKGVHSLRTRFLGSSAISVDLHMEVDPNMKVVDADTIAHHVEQKLITEIDDVVDVVIHIDPCKLREI